MNKVLPRVIGLAISVGIILMIMYSQHSGGPALPGQQKMRFALVPKSIGHPYWEGVREGMLAAAQRLGVESVFQGPPDASIEEQIKIIESLIALGYDGIGISPNDPGAVKDVIKRAMAKGIAVVTFDSDSPDSERLLYIGTDNRAAGGVGAKAMIQVLGAKPAAERTDKLLVQVMGGRPGVFNLTQRMEGFAAGVKGTNIVLAPDQYNQENVDNGLQIFEAVLTANPDLRGFFGSNAYAGPAAALAVKNALQRGKLQKGQLHVVSFDTTEDILNYVEEGLIDCTLAQNTREMGRLSIERLADFARAYREQKAFARPPRGQDVIDTGVTVVWPADVPKYRSQPKSPD
jgi:ribose transport system substrate-binding protein